MLIDCFMFSTEYDILEGRLEYLYNKVDKFVIVEANISFNGSDKPLNFLNNINRYKKYIDKIFYYPVFIDKNNYDFSLRQYAIDPGSRDTGYWAVEQFQRNHIAKALEFFKDDDFVMIGDADEIPSKYGIDMALEHIDYDYNPMIGFKQDMFYYNFKYLQENDCFGTVLCTNRIAKQNSPQWVRENRWGHQIPFIYGGGWHLSFWGSPETIQNKIITYSHQEFNSEKVRDINNIVDNIKNGKDVFSDTRGNVLLPVDRNNIDPEVLTIFEKYGINIE